MAPLHGGTATKKNCQCYDATLLSSTVPAESPEEVEQELVETAGAALGLPVVPALGLPELRGLPRREAAKGLGLVR